MSNQRTNGENTSGQNARKILFWILGVLASIAMLYYEYLWSRFAFHSEGTISLVKWFWTSLAIALPWNLGFSCVGSLRGAVRDGKFDHDLYSNVRLGLVTLVLSAFWWPATEIHRLTSLGALN